MPYNLFLLPLIGGFLFVHFAHYFRFAAQRQDGYRLLFQSAIAGVWLSAVARLVDVLIDLSPVGPDVQRVWQIFSPFDYSATSALSLLLGPAFAIALNVFIPKEKAKDLEISKRGNGLIKLLHRAEKDNRLISVTLDTRKWYVGWVAESPNLDPQELYFRLLPFISGYRDKDNLKTRRTVYYEAVLEDETLDRRELVVTLPMKDVKIAGFFDDELYDEFFAGTQDESAGS